MKTKAYWEAIDQKHYEDVLREYEHVSAETKLALDLWIATYMKPAKNINGDIESYVLKRRFESTIGVGNYVTHDQFKGAMLSKGFIPQCSWVKTWSFRIRKVKIDPSKLSKKWGRGERW